MKYHFNRPSRHDRVIRLRHLRQTPSLHAVMRAQSTNQSVSALLQVSSVNHHTILFLHGPPPPSGLPGLPKLIFLCLKARQEFVKITPSEVSHYYGRFTLIVNCSCILIIKHNNFSVYFIQSNDSSGSLGDNKHTLEERLDVDVDNRRQDIQVEASG